MTKAEKGINLYRFIFFIGWLLSPLTFWNDTFVNIPLSYLSANIFIRFFRADFLFTVLVFYWLSNVIGVVIMVASGQHIIRSTKQLIGELVKFGITVVIYSAILIALNKFGVLRPL